MGNDKNAKQKPLHSTQENWREQFEIQLTQQ